MSQGWISWHEGASKVFKGDITYVWILGPSMTIHGRLTPAQALPARLKALAKAGQGNTCCNLYRFSIKTDRHAWKKWLNQTKYGLHGQPAINSWFPHVVPKKKSSWLYISDRWGDGSSSIACRLGPAGAGGDCHWQDRCDPTWSVLENGCLGVNGNPLV